MTSLFVVHMIFHVEGPTAPITANMHDTES
jgi:hypothetical protein